MKKESKNFFKEVKKQADKTIDEVKQYTHDTKEMIEVYQAFKKEAVKMKRTTSNFINLDMPIYGIPSDNWDSMTFRAKDTLEEGQILQSGKNTLKIVSINDEVVFYPVKVNENNLMVECRVAVLQKI